MLKHSKSSKRVCLFAISIGLIFLLAGSSYLIADESLDKMLASAMDNHPDIVAAKAKVALAEAELNAMRLQVARQIIALWGNRNSHEFSLDSSQKQLPVIKDQEKRVALVQNIQDTRVKLDQAEAEIKFLTEKFEKSGASDANKTNQNSPTAREVVEIPPPNGTVVDAIGKEFRTKSIEFDFNGIPLEAVISYMADHLKYPVYLDKKSLDAAGIAADSPISLKMQKTPLPAAIQAFQDQNQGMVFVIRNYGLLLTTAENANEQHFYPALDFFN